ncbi:hypothetical protein JCM8547_003612 [Rhodosporidiobolus lusitaniae]
MLVASARTVVPSTSALFLRRSLATVASSPSIRSIRPSAAELEAGRLTQRNLQKALEALHTDGMFALEDVVHHGALDKLNTRMLKDTKALMDMGDNGPFNYNKGNIQQDPPVEPDTFDRSIFLNPLATSVTSAYLGGKPTLAFLSGNTAVQDKEGKGQPVHADSDFAHPEIPFACVVNVGLVEMTPENGSTECWLGTHVPPHSGLQAQEGLHGERASGRIRQELLDARRKVSPPFQPTVPKGSLLIRDLRLWHAGRPNPSPSPRIMLASIHFAPWYREQMAVALPVEMKEELEQEAEKQGLRLSAEWGKRDTLAVKYGNSYDFSNDSEKEGRLV